jgi:hypothetical protein
VRGLGYWVLGMHSWFLLGLDYVSNNNSLQLIIKTSTSPDLSRVFGDLKYIVRLRF